MTGEAWPEAGSGEQVAALDLGSNSFHLIVGRLVGDRIHVVDRLKETVRLGAQLDEDGRIPRVVEERALECLQRMGQLLRDMPASQVRVVGTNALRRALHPAPFIEAASAALGHRIRIISGIEEARLIYKGVVVGLEGGRRRLVVDIGGGSTEVIVGDSEDPAFMESLHMGCVTFTDRFHGNGRVSRKRLQRAVLAGRQELEPIVGRCRKLGWEEALGASGTVRAVDEVARWAGHEGIHADSLADLGRIVCEIGRVERLAEGLPLSRDRAPVFAGGLAVITALVEALDIEKLVPADGALREGLLYELVGRRQEDVRSRTVRRLMGRYSVDEEHAGRVGATAGALLEQVATSWGLEGEEPAALLSRACQLHEVGLAIAHSRYHHHGEYLLRYADLPGFSRDEQAALADLVRAHRRKITAPVPSPDLTPPYELWVPRLVPLIRLAAILNRARSGEAAEVPSITGDRGAVQLRFAEGWLSEHALTLADLHEEQRFLRAIGIKLSYR